MRIALKTGIAVGKNSDYMFKDRLVYFKQRIYILDEPRLKLKEVHKYYNSKVAGHFRRDKILELMKHNYYWPN